MDGANSCSLRGTTIPILSGPVVHIGATSVDGDDDEVQVIMVSAILMHELWTLALCHRSPSNAALFCLSQRSDKCVPQILTDHVALQVGLTLYVAGWGIGPGGPELGQSILSTLKLEAHQLLDAPHCNKSMLWDGDIHGGMLCGLAQEGQANCIVNSGSPIILLDMPGYDVDCSILELDFVVGINTNGAPCRTPANIYLDLRDTAPWIQRHFGVWRT